MPKLEDARQPYPMPKAAVNGMLAGLLVASPAIGMVGGYLLGGYKGPLSHDMQVFLTAEFGLGALIAFAAFVAGKYRT